MQFEMQSLPWSVFASQARKSLVPGTRLAFLLDSCGVARRDTAIAMVGTQVAI
jgi:hypothetical protein